MWKIYRSGSLIQSFNRARALQNAYVPELEGKIRFTLSTATLKELCKRFVPNFDTERLEPIAIRLYRGEETVLTIYAVDTISLKHPEDPARQPTRKFKVQLKSGAELLDMIPAFNFTVAMEGHELDEMEIINK